MNNLLKLNLLLPIINSTYQELDLERNVRPEQLTISQYVSLYNLFTKSFLNLLKYMIRSLLSLQRLSFDETEGQVCYQYDKSQPKEERMNSMSPLEVGLR